MAFTIKKAKRSMAKLKFAIAGSSGSGKTLGSLLFGYGLIKAAHPGMPDAEIWEKICVIDTENESASLYVGSQYGKHKVGEYLTIPMEPPFTPQRYMEAIEVAEDAGVEYLIIDSLSHAWSGEGGMLDIQNKASIKSGNSYTAWREVTPLHNRLIDKLLQCDMHIGVTMRTKTEYTIEENERGKKTPRKIGMAPIFRDGIEYEFTIFFEVGQDHYASASKDRTSLFDGRTFQIDPSIGAEVYGWLAGAVPEEKEIKIVKPSSKKIAIDPIEEPTPVESTTASSDEDDDNDLPWEKHKPNDAVKEISQEELNKIADTVLSSVNDDELDEIAAAIKEVNGGKSNYKKIASAETRLAVAKIFAKYEK